MEEEEEDTCLEEEIDHMGRDRMDSMEDQEIIKWEEAGEVGKDLAEEAEEEIIECSGQ